jgi:hypothetical protein
MIWSRCSVDFANLSGHLDGVIVSMFRLCRIQAVLVDITFTIILGILRISRETCRRQPQPGEFQTFPQYDPVRLDKTGFHLYCPNHGEQNATPKNWLLTSTPKSQHTAQQVHTERLHPADHEKDGQAEHSS